MRWIFSDPTPSTSAVPYSVVEEEEIRNYGPQLKRKGNIKFVKAKGSSLQPVERKRRALYHDLEPSQELPKLSQPADLDLSNEPDTDDDDIIFYSPTTLLPLPPLPTSHFQREQRESPSISQLLADHPPTAPPRVVPTPYGIGSDTIGWKILAKQGWREGEGLGKATGSFLLDEEGGLIKDSTLMEGIKVPILPVERMNRSGLGITQEKRKRPRDNGLKVKKKGKRERGRERERKEMLAYLNR